MTRLRSQSGHTLVELLLAAMLTLLISAAALTTLQRSVTLNKRNQQLTEDTEASRNAIDLLARDTRDSTAYQTAANATAAAVLRADPTDFVFKTVDPKGTASANNTYRVRSVRYCYTGTSLLRQTKTDAVLPAGACPDTSWTTTASVPFVVNGARSMFTYDSADPTAVTKAVMSLWVDSTPNKAPVETPLSTGVFLRNANRSPAAAFTATAAPDQHVSLNGSSSLDPDGESLKFAWKDNGVVIPNTTPVVDYVAATTGIHTFTLTVTDRGGLTSTTTQDVTVLP
jgi:type II secretory pathway pseudopilin PulG